MTGADESGPDTDNTPPPIAALMVAGLARGVDVGPLDDGLHTAVDFIEDEMAALLTEAAAPTPSPGSRSESRRAESSPSRWRPI
jgi:hypothetical protein